MIQPYAVVGPLLRLAPPETAHRLAIHALRLGLVRPGSIDSDPAIRVSRWGLEFPNPIGIAAGFDKNAEVCESFPGVGFVEVGTVTPRPQSGNPRPRVFRLSDDRAVINRLGFNNDGLEAVRARLQARAGRRIVGANVGCNRDSADPVADYVTGFRTLGPHADYVAVNVSSPNTPGLRDLQRGPALRTLLGALLEARRELGSDRFIPLLLKIAPDLSDPELGEIVDVATDLGIDGLIVGNTTLSRPPRLRSEYRSESGGLSGAPLRDLSTNVLRRAARFASGRLTLVGVGGVGSALDAYEKIRAGASLVQLYTALIYEGPELIAHIVRGLAEALKRDGFGSIDAAIGVDVA
jgi:dihydroorotate dehydrogenase